MGGAMTLIVGLRGSEGLVLATDSRATIGDPRGVTAVNDVQENIFQLSSHVGVALTGAVEVGAKLIDTVRREHAGLADMDVEASVGSVRTTARRCYDDWFEKFEVGNRPGLGFLFQGYKSPGHTDPEPRTYLLSSNLDFAPQLFPAGIAMAGAVQYSIYLADWFYSPGLSTHRIAHLAAFLISETASQDPKVGGPIRIATITASEGFVLLDEDSVGEICEGNSRQREEMKAFFQRRKGGRPLGRPPSVSPHAQE